MSTINREIWIDAPVEQVWEVLADFGNISAWNPNVPNSYLTSSQESGVGMSRHCDLTLYGATVEERVLAWEEGKSMTIELYETTKSPPMKRALATLSVRPERGGTLATAHFDYALKMGPVGALMDAMMVRSQFSKAFEKLLAGLEHYVVHGTKAVRSAELPLERVIALPA